MQQKIISFRSFTAQEFERMVCCPMVWHGMLLYDKLCVVHWLLSKNGKYYSGNKSSYNVCNLQFFPCKVYKNLFVQREVSQETDQ